MQCTIRWHNAPVTESFPLIYPLLQAPPYARAMQETEKFTPRFGLIYLDDQPAGSVLMLEVKALFGLVHGIVLDRGPLWFEGYGGIAHIKCFFDHLHQLYPPRWGRKRRFMPEIEDGPTARKLIEGTGLTRQGEGYQTLLLDLSQPVESLRANLESKWRNALSKAEKQSGIAIEWDQASVQLPWFFKVYQRDQRIKNYTGPSPLFLSALARLSPQDHPMMMGRVISDGAAISAVLIACHGGNATYLAGWTGEEGRKLGGHHLLLWDALSMLQQQGVHMFDLGGIDEDHAKGLTHFKEGMGGKRYRLVGRYS